MTEQGSAAWGALRQFGAGLLIGLLIFWPLVAFLLYKVAT